MLSQSKEILSGGWDLDCLELLVSKGGSKTHQGAPDTGQEKGEVVHLGNLIDETPNILREKVRVMFHKKIEVDPMLSTSEKGLSVLQAINQNGLIFDAPHGKNLLVNICLYHFQNKGSRINRF